MEVLQDKPTDKELKECKNNYLSLQNQKLIANIGHNNSIDRMQKQL